MVSIQVEIEWRDRIRYNILCSYEKLVLTILAGAKTNKELSFMFYLILHKGFDEH